MLTDTVHVINAAPKWHNTIGDGLSGNLTCHIYVFFELSFLYVSLQFPSMFPLLTYSQSFFSLSVDYPRHSRRRRSQILILLIQDKSKNYFTT